MAPFITNSLGCLLLLLLLSFSTFSNALTDSEAAFIAQRQLLTFDEHGRETMPPGAVAGGDDVNNLKFENPRQKNAYIALQAWKKGIYSDPFNVTTSWVGPEVCNYKGVFCAPALDDPKINVVAGIDLNHQDIAGYMPHELGLLTDLALFHMNSNRFCGIVPMSFCNMSIMFEFDVSNNRLVGPFPQAVLCWKQAKFIDIRFNDFEGCVPPEIFTRPLDALFLNNNRFTCGIPPTLGNSTVSVVTFAYNNFSGCVPQTIGMMPNLQEIILAGNSFGGCFPSDIGNLKNLTVLDVSASGFVGPIPASFAGLKSVERLDISCNRMTGTIPEEICKLPALKNFTYNANFFDGAAPACIPGSRKDVVMDDANNCLADRPMQKPSKDCDPAVVKPVDCSKDACGGGSPAPPKPKSPPTEDPHMPASGGMSHPPPAPVHSPPPPAPVHSPPPPAPVHSPPPPPVQSPPPPAPVHSPPPPVHSPPPPPVHSPPPPVFSPPPPVHSPPPPPVHSPPPPVHSPPPPVHSPPPPVYSPPPPVHSPPPPVHSPPPPPVQSPPPPVHSPPPPVVQKPPPKPEQPEVVLPPNLGYQYSSPPPPMFPGY